MWRHAGERQQAQPTTSVRHNNPLQHPRGCIPTPLLQPQRRCPHRTATAQSNASSYGAPPPLQRRRGWCKKRVCRADEAEFFSRLPSLFLSFRSSPSLPPPPPYPQQPTANIAHLPLASCASALSSSPFHTHAHAHTHTHAHTYTTLIVSPTFAIPRSSLSVSPAAAAPLPPRPPLSPARARTRMSTHPHCADL